MSKLIKQFLNFFLKFIIQIKTSYPYSKDSLNKIYINQTNVNKDKIKIEKM